MPKSVILIFGPTGATVARPPGRSSNSHPIRALTSRPSRGGWSRPWASAISKKSRDAGVREGRRRQEVKVRTVVTGHSAKGRSVVVQDEKVEGIPIPGLGELALLWNADEPATYPNAGSNPAAPGIFPPLGGIRFLIGTYLPGDFIAPEPVPGMHLEDGDELGGANAGFHRTDTTDFGVVLSGNLALQLDDGAEVSLSPGDVLIENGTRHRWRVVGNVPATLASFIIGAHRH